MLELRNPRQLNAEDDTTLVACEARVDLILLDPEVEIGVLRGGVGRAPALRRPAHLRRRAQPDPALPGQLPFIFFVTRDLGFVNKIYRGLEPEPGASRSSGSRRPRPTRSAAPASCCTWSTT